MITEDEDFVAWAGLLTELDEAKEHLASLVDTMVKEGKIAPDEFAVQMGHIYAQLNRAWHSRNQTEEISEEQWAEFSAFPKDVVIYG